MALEFNDASFQTDVLEASTLLKESCNTPLLYAAKLEVMSYPYASFAASVVKNIFTPISLASSAMSSLESETSLKILK